MRIKKTKTKTNKDRESDNRQKALYHLSVYKKKKSITIYDSDLNNR